MKVNVIGELKGSYAATTTKQYFMAEVRATRSISHGAPRNACCPDTRSEVPSLCGGECNVQVLQDSCFCLKMMMPYHLCPNQDVNSC